VPKGAAFLRPGVHDGPRRNQVHVQGDDSDLRNVRRFNEQLPGTEAFCLSRATAPRKVAGVNVLPWAQGLEILGLGVGPLLSSTAPPEP